MSSSFFQSLSLSLQFVLKKVLPLGKKTRKKNIKPEGKKEEMKEEGKTSILNEVTIFEMSKKSKFKIQKQDKGKESTEWKNVSIHIIDSILSSSSFPH